jgi:formate dehydrogenase major subunit/NADH-quinone oxidoreductase subunit G
MLCTIIIEGKEIRVKTGSNLLWAALDNGFFIPNLCSIADKPKPYASCRLCFVEIGGRPEPVTACTEKTQDGMVVRVHTPRIVRLRLAAFDLLLSNHRLDCAHCVKNRNCELQKIAHAEHFKLRGSLPFFLVIARPPQRPWQSGQPLDTSHPLINFDRSKCVLCGRCVWVCQEQGRSVLDFAYRGIRTTISTFAGIPLAETGCDSCLACTAVCPVGALYLKSLLPGAPADKGHKPAAA